jgi:hypothetical protein
MKKKAYFFVAAFCAILSCSESVDLNTHNKGIELVVLGTIQDAGSPQIGCKKKNAAKNYWRKESLKEWLSR